MASEIVPDKPPADLLREAKYAVTRAIVAAQASTLMSEEQEADAAIDRAVEDSRRKAIQMGLDAIGIALSKRDAEWREAAKMECLKSCIGSGLSEKYQCAACRTVARMEGK